MPPFNGKEYEGGGVYRWMKSYGNKPHSIALLTNDVRHYDIYVSPPDHVGPKYLIVVHLVSQSRRIAYDYEFLLPRNMDKWFRSRAAWPMS